MHFGGCFVTIIFGLFLCVELQESRVAFKPRPDGRIVGGYEVTNLTQVPYQVSLQLSGRHFCGGSFISQEWVLTAAHCTNGVRASRLSLRAGSLRHSEGGVVIHIEKIVQHPKFDSNTIDYDFSLLQLESWSPYRIVFEPAKLPHQGDDIKDGTLLKASGWGDTKNSTVSSSALRAVEIPKFNQRSCNRIYRSHGGITNRMICAGFEQGGKDSCQGDSGGPLTLNETLIGVVSWGYGCAEPNYPGVYSRVSSVRDWIKSITGL